MTVPFSFARRCLLPSALLFSLSPCALAAPAAASARMNAPGPDAAALALRAGRWDVIETSWASPGATPDIVKGQIAERRMVGLYLQEVLHPAGLADAAHASRLDYLGFNRVTSRWEYLSLDTRAPVGLMPAWSFDHDPVTRIRVQFDAIALPGGGAAVTGQLLRMEEIIEQAGPNAETKDQYFILADGSGARWLAYRYAYVRRLPR